MCGIVYSKSFIGKPVNNTIKKRFLDQKHRGTDGFGFYMPETNRLLHNTKQGRTLTLLRRTKASEVLFHHRLPTSTVNVRNACHPFSTKDYFEHNYVVVHNGVLHNEDELKKGHDDLGISYISEQKDGSYNDSEALAYDIAMYMEGFQSDIKAVGSIAFVAIKRSHDGEAISLIYGRNTGNPLMRKQTKNSLTLSSEGEGVQIAPNTIYEYNYKTGKTTESYANIKTYNYYGSGGAYSGYGDYQGYNSGYDWASYDAAIAERMEVKEAYDDIMYDFNYDIWMAYDEAQSVYEMLQAEERKLWFNLYEEDPVGGEVSPQEYTEVEHQVKIMKKVVEKIESEALGYQTQMGFSGKREIKQIRGGTS